MERLKRSDAHAAVNNLNRIGMNLTLDYNITGGRIVNENNRDLSPRLKLPALMCWLDGFTCATMIFKNENPKS